MKAHRAIVLTIALTVPMTGFAAAKTKFWNLTAETITDLRLAPAGTGKFGPNLTAADKDGTVDHDENLTVTGVKSGRYDAKFVDAKGRHCTVPNVEVKEGETFSLDENELPAACRK